jgi:predicted acyltransferase
LISLDIFRGMTIAAMILVNNPGSWEHIYPPLAHARWHGLTPTDLIFPFFLFIVGVSIKFSLDRQILSKAPPWKIYRRILGRASVLFLLGEILAGFPRYDLGTLRIPGVLQRIALCYLGAALLYVRTAGAEEGEVKFSPRPLAWLTGFLLVFYYLVMKFVPFPGGVAGDWTVPDGNIAAFVDRCVFGTRHLWRETATRDPEGILSTIPALGSVLIGVIAGWWLSAGKDRLEKASTMLVCGFVLACLGYAATALMPFNKNLWTPSFVLATSGLALLFLGSIYWFADIHGRREGTLPFLVYGSNAIAVYFLSELADIVYSLIPAGDCLLRDYPYKHWLQPAFGDNLGSLAYAVATVLLWLGVMWVFYRKKIFIKV